MPRIAFATMNESVHITIATTATKRQLVAMHQNSEKLHELTVRYGRAKMIDRDWLRKNAESCIESLKQKPELSIENQGILNVLEGTLTLLDDTEFLLSKDEPKIPVKDPEPRFGHGYEYYD